MKEDETIGCNDTETTERCADNPSELSGRWPLDISAIEEKERETKCFAEGLNGYKLFWVFLFACFFGVFIETIFWFNRTHQIVSRASFVLGPLNIVYGLGGLLLTIVLYRLRNKPILFTVIAGMLIGCSVEYFCSLLQEVVFGSISWHYSDAFDIHGRTNLKYALYWGLLAIFWIKIIYPAFSLFVLRIPRKMAKPLTWVLVVFMVFNAAISFIAVQRWSERKISADTVSTEENLIDQWFPDESMEKIFPNMRFIIEAQS